jgi:hypothetical protein
MSSIPIEKSWDNTFTRRIDTHEYPKISRSGLYDQINLRGTGCVKIHFLFAKQWIHNPDPDVCNEIDHIDGDTDNNNITNLRYCSRVENLRNRHKNKGESFEFLNELTEGVEEFSRYNHHELEPGYFKDANKNVYFQFFINGKKTIYKLLERLHCDKYPCYNVKIKGGREIPAIIRKI